MNPTNQMQRISDELNEHGIKARPWYKRDMYRVYIADYGRDITAYIENVGGREVSGENLYENCRLRVFTNAKNVDGSWIVNRRKQVAHAIAIKLSEVFDLPPISEDWEDFILI